MKQPFLFLVFVALCTCSNKGNEHSIANHQKGKAICLDYSSEYDFPRILRFHKGHIYVGNGLSIFKFDKTGKLLNEYMAPEDMKASFLDFLPLESTSEESFLITVYEALFEFTPSKYKLLVPKFGEKIRNGSSDFLFSPFQKYDSLSGQVTNGLRGFEYRSGKVFEYPSRNDLGTYNVELISRNLGLISNDIFYVLPLDTTKSIFNHHLDLSTEDTGATWFLGMQNNLYVFRTFNYKEQQDHLHFFDSNLKFLAEAVVDVAVEDLNERVQNDSDFRVDSPSGNVYHFESDSQNIYLMRNTKTKTCIYNILDAKLEVIRGTLNGRQ